MNINLNHGEINKRIGKAIAKQRQQSGYTQEQVAEMLEIGNEAVSRMERGLIMPNVVRLIELAEKDRQLMLNFLDSFARRLKQE